VRLATGLRAFTVPEMDHVLDADFGDNLALVGYSVEPEQPSAGQLLTVTLVWQAGATPARDATVFVHLQDADGRLVAQHDGPPAEGRRPVTGWLPGEVIVDRHGIALPVDLPAGTYQLGAGLYDPETGERWLARQGGAVLPEGKVPIFQRIELKPAP
jgi:hypothetical protein